MIFGALSALNLAGSVLGSLAAGFALLPMLGLQTSAILVAAVAAAGCVVACAMSDDRATSRARYAVAAAGVAGWAAIAFLPGTRLPHDYLYQDGTLLAVAEGRGSTLAVVRRHNRNVLEIDRLWQGEDLRCHQVMAAHVPAILHGDLKDVLVIGMGVGQTASRFLMHGVNRLDCVEIEPAVVPLIQSHFGGDWLNDRRVHVIVDDGRGYTAHALAKYDCVSIEVGQLFRQGAAAFYTADFYRDVADRLKPGGIVSQFLPVNVLDVGTAADLVATFLHVFPNAVLWYNTTEFLLTGSKDARLTLDARKLRVLTDNPVVADDLAFA